MLYLWKIQQQNEADGSEWYNHGTWFGAVVAAETEEEAKKIHPSGFENQRYELNWPYFRPERILVQRLGRAERGIKKGVVIGRFDD